MKFPMGECDAAATDEVDPPGLPRRPASELELRPKPDRRLADWT